MIIGSKDARGTFLARTGSTMSKGNEINARNINNFRVGMKTSVT